MTQKLPSYSSYESHWHHDPNTVFLNHGSFGACPDKILQLQQLLQQRLEKEPVKFMTDEFIDLYLENKKALAEFVGCHPDDLVFVRNATTGVNTIMNSLTFREDDEIVSHSHAYGACQNVLVHYAEKFGCKVINAEIPFPIQHENEVIEAFLKVVTPKTKLVMADHITSATGLVFPIEKLVKELEGRGIEVLVDGAHGPGMTHLELEKLGASYYTGNCHKWICSPKGSALLYVRKDKQSKINPLNISHKNDLFAGTDSHWSAQFIWPGTEDFSAYLCVKDSINYMGNLFGSWEELRERNRALCLSARKSIAAKTGTPLPAPDTMISHLANILVDEHAEMPAVTFNMMSPIKKILQEKYHIQVPVFLYNKNNLRAWVRIAVQAYNSPEQYEYLGDCLKEIKEGR